MSNTFVNYADNLSATASALIGKDLVIAGVVNRDFDKDFNVTRGSVVNVRIPAALGAANSVTIGTVGTPTVATLAESTQPVALTDNVYVLLPLSDEDVTLGVTDYAAQVIMPITRSIAEKIEAMVTAKLQSLTADSALSTLYVPGAAYSATGNVLDLFRAARKELRDLGAPMTGLYAAIGTGVYQDIQGMGSSAGILGGATDPFINGPIDRVAGFAVVESNRLGSDEAIFFHRDAVTLVLRAPNAPAGFPGARTTLAENGAPVRLIETFDPSSMGWQITANTFAGAALMEAQNSTTGTPVTLALRVSG